MILPISWLEKYIKLEHSVEEFGNIMTKLDTMQDGPIKVINKNAIINLEVRQDRPDLMSIIGLAREYAAYIDKPVLYPETYTSNDIIWNLPKKLLKISDSIVVKRFIAIKIKNIKVKPSPDWLKNDLELYGIPSINNVVDITNYVMLEYGIPLHAFDYSKLKKLDDSPILTLRKANENEEFITWQKTKLSLTKEDTVVADGEKAVAIAGIIGGINSGIENSTKTIILESANYLQSAVRRTSLRHGIRTDSSSRHEKFLNPNMCEVAIRRALHLILQLAEAEIELIEDYYKDKSSKTIIDFNTSEIRRLGGVNLSLEVTKDLLSRLGFVLLDYKKSDSVNKEILSIESPIYRTDINLDADLVEEVLRLWGYDQIPFQEIRNAPPEDITPKSYYLEEKIRDLLVSINLDEHITEPLVEYTNEKNQILLENSLSKMQNALRLSLWETLINVSNQYVKKNINKGVFEVGKIYAQVKIGEYQEENRIVAIYKESNQNFFNNIIKPNLLYVMQKIDMDLESKDIKAQSNDKELVYLYKGKIICALRYNGFEIYTDNLVEFVNLQNIPKITVSTNNIQQIIEDFTFVESSNSDYQSKVDSIKSFSEYIKDIYVKNEYSNKELEQKDKKSISISVVFEDANNSLKRSYIEQIRKKILNTLNIKSL